MNLYGNPVCAIAGQKGGLQGVTESHIAGENIEMGAALFGKVGDDRVFGTHQNVVALLASADLVASNKLSATVNDVELDAVDFVTDTDTTLSALAEAINANDELSQAGIGASVVAGTKTITIAGDGDVTASIVVTGGESQATFSATSATGMKFVGVAVHEECKEYRCERDDTRENLCGSCRRRRCGGQKGGLCCAFGSGQGQVHGRGFWKL